MFQVASHPTSFDAFASGPLSPTFDMPMSPASALVQLPRSLARPRPSTISRDAIIQASPDLADVPLEYIRSGLAQQAPAMLAAIQALAPHIPAAASRSSLPSAISLPASSSAPTHILAVSSSSKSAAAGPVALIPSHQLLLLSSCALLPGLPAARSGTAPIVPVAVPSADTFAALHAFLYNRSAIALLSALLCLPIPPAAAAGPSDPVKRAGQLATALVHASSGDAGRLMGIAKRVNGLWRNACALGVHDLELWDAMDLAWDAVLGAMNAVARR